MKKAESSKAVTKTLPSFKIEDIYQAVWRYRPLMRKLAGNGFPAEDLEQEVLLKLLKRSALEPDWWNKIENKRSYLLRVIRNKAVDLKRIPSNNFISLDDEENSSLLSKLSDLGGWVEALDEDIDLEKFRLKLQEIMGSFTEREQTILKRSFFEHVMPKKIAEELGENPIVMGAECNRLKAKFRAHFKKHLLSKDF